MIDIKKKNKKLIFIYDTRNGSDNNEWVYDKLNNEGEWHWKRKFFFQKDDLLTSFTNSDKPVEFTIAIEDSKNYYKIPKRILDIQFNLFIHKSIEITRRTFLTDDNNVSIFKILSNSSSDDVYIGGDKEEAITKSTFKEIVESIPTKHEKYLYTEARIDAVLKNYFETGKNAESKLKKYLNKKISAKGENLNDKFKQYELSKLEQISEKLNGMLINESKYNERQWQEEILGIILLLYPKYIHVFKDTPVKDLYAGKDRELDFLLVDAGGNIDIIEIKQPFDNSIVTKSQYRDNYIPLRELSGTVMQIEKYLFYLNSWGKKGEEKLTEKYKKELPDDFKVQITNPSGIIIMGRHNGLSKEQLRDFEVIKRQYKNVIDIITYDDLLHRLKFMISQLKNK